MNLLAIEEKVTAADLYNFITSAQSNNYTAEFSFMALCIRLLLHFVTHV